MDIKSVIEKLDIPVNRKDTSSVSNLEWMLRNVGMFGRHQELDLREFRKEIMKLLKPA